MSTASTRARGNAFAQARAIAPEPVPMSRIRRTPRAFAQGEKRLTISSPVREIRKRLSLCDSPVQQSIDACAAVRSERPRVGAGAFGMSDSGGKKHQFRGLIARIIGPVPKMRAAARERVR